MISFLRCCPPPQSRVCSGGTSEPETVEGLSRAQIDQMHSVAPENCCDTVRIDSGYVKRLGANLHGGGDV